MAWHAHQLSHSLTWRTASSQQRLCPTHFLPCPLPLVLPSYCEKSGCASQSPSTCAGACCCPPRAVPSPGWTSPSPTASPPRATTALTSLVALVQLTGSLRGWPKLDANQVSRSGINPLDLLATFPIPSPPKWEKGRARGQEEEEQKIHLHKQT